MLIFFKDKDFDNLYFNCILQERESLFLLDEKRVSVLYVPSGKTKRSIPKVTSLLSETVFLTSSPGGKFNFLVPIVNQFWTVAFMRQDKSKYVIQCSLTILRLALKKNSMPFLIN